NFPQHHFSVAIEQNTEEGFRNIIDKSCPGIHLKYLIHNFVKRRYMRWAVCYGESGGSTLDSHYAFVVDYGLARDGEVDLHVDDAYIALNICLGYEFSTDNCSSGVFDVMNI
ncbi:hypothetical protein V8G54_017544, partial [Vigna mungo]